VKENPTAEGGRRRAAAGGGGRRRAAADSGSLEQTAAVRGRQRQPRAEGGDGSAAYMATRQKAVAASTAGAARLPEWEPTARPWLPTDGDQVVLLANLHRSLTHEALVQDLRERLRAAVRKVTLAPGAGGGPHGAVVTNRGWDTNDFLPCGTARATCGDSARRQKPHTLTWFCGGSCGLQFVSRPTAYQHIESPHEQTA